MNTETKNNTQINIDNEEKELIIDYSKRLLNLEKEIKDVREDIKIIKKEAKDQGVPIAILNKAIKKLKEVEKEKADLTSSEIDLLQAILEEDPEVTSLIKSLMAKN